KFFQHLGVVVFADAGVDAIIPIVQAADEVVPLHKAVGEQAAAVQAASEQHRHLVAIADHDQVDISDQRIGGRAIGESRPTGHDYLVHSAPPEAAIAGWCV